MNSVNLFVSVYVWVWNLEVNFLSYWVFETQVANRNMRDKDSNPNVHERQSFNGSFVSMEEPKPETRAGPGLISCTTFNILAPIYKRLDQQVSSLSHFAYESVEFVIVFLLSYEVFDVVVWNRIKGFVRVNSAHSG